MLKNKGSFCVFKNILEVVAIMVKDEEAESSVGCYKRLKRIVIN